MPSRLDFERERDEIATVDSRLPCSVDLLKMLEFCQSRSHLYRISDKMIRKRLKFDRNIFLYIISLLNRQLSISLVDLYNKFLSQTEMVKFGFEGISPTILQSYLEENSKTSQTCYDVFCQNIRDNYRMFLLLSGRRVSLLGHYDAELKVYIPQQRQSEHVYWSVKSEPSSSSISLSSTEYPTDDCICSGDFESCTASSSSFLTSAEFSDFSSQPFKRSHSELSIGIQPNLFTNQFGTVVSWKCKLLYEKAVQFVSKSKFAPFTRFSRCKPRAYWDRIFNVGKEKRYRKDMGGHSCSPINVHQLYGLFFSALTPQGQLITASPFGDTKMSIPAIQLLVSSSKCRLYFADFYCNIASRQYQRVNKNVVHYVTLVVTHRGSEADAFCAGELLELNIGNNAFLVCQKNKYWLVGRAWIEIFYTEDVELSMAQLQPIEPTSGTSRPFGVANDKSCPICNV